MSGVVKGIGKVAGAIPGIGSIASAGLGIAGSLFGKPGSTVTETGIDSFINPFRQDLVRRAQQLSTQSFDPASIQAFMNPFQQQVESATIADFDRLRGNLMNDIAGQATLSGAQGGSRQGVLEAVGQGELARAEAGALADLRFSGYQDSLNRAQAEPYQRLGFFKDVLSGVPQTQTLTTRETGNTLNRVVGGATAGLSFYDLLKRRQGGVPTPGVPTPRVINTTSRLPGLRLPSAPPVYGGR